MSNLNELNTLNGKVKELTTEEYNTNFDLYMEKHKNNVEIQKQIQTMLKENNIKDIDYFLGYGFIVKSLRNSNFYSNIETAIKVAENFKNGIYGVVSFNKKNNINDIFDDHARGRQHQFTACESIGDSCFYMDFRNINNFKEYNLDRFNMKVKKYFEKYPYMKGYMDINYSIQ